MAETVYWTMRNGQQISVDDMDINHLRNTLKMILRNKQVRQSKPQLSNIQKRFLEAEIEDDYEQTLQYLEGDFPVF